MHAHAPFWIQPATLFAMLREEGVAISPSQLARWQQLGLAPRATRKGLGRGQGTESRYPLAALVHLRVLAGFRQRYPHRLSRVAWGLWATGLPVTLAIRRQLIADFEPRVSLADVASRALSRWGEDENPLRDRLVWGRNSPMPSASSEGIENVDREDILKSVLAAIASKPELGPNDRDFRRMVRNLARTHPREKRLAPEEMRAMVQRLTSKYLPGATLAAVPTMLREATERTLENWRDNSIGLWNLLRRDSAQDPFFMPQQFFAICLGIVQQRPTFFDTLRSLFMRPSWAVLWRPPIASLTDHYEGFVESLRSHLHPAITEDSTP